MRKNPPNSIKGIIKGADNADDIFGDEARQETKYPGKNINNKYFEYILKFVHKLLPKEDATLATITNIATVMRNLLRSGLKPIG